MHYFKSHSQLWMETQLVRGHEGDIADKCCSSVVTSWSVSLVQGWLVDLINKFGTLNGFQILHDRFMSVQALNVQIIAALIKYVPLRSDVLLISAFEPLDILNASRFVFQTFRPMLRVPDFAHGEEVLLARDRDGSAVSGEPHRRGAEERGQE